MSAGRTVLRNVRVFDGHSVLAPGTVLIDGAVVGDPTLVPAGAEDTIHVETVDAEGGVLIPGLIDAHVHPVDASTLETLVSYGVTTALDMGTWPASLVASLRGGIGVTDLRSCGIGASSPASAHGRRPGRPADGLVAGPDGAEHYVRDRVAEGADHIKVIIDLPGFDQPTLDALVASAHRHGRRTVMHASTTEAVRMAQASGVDVVTHAPLDVAMTDDEVAEMVAAGRVTVPTLAMMEAIVARVGQADGHGPRYKAARDTVTALYRAGVPVLAGTDANDAQGVPASPPFGDSLHHELELLVAAGLSTVDALRAATAVVAEHFDLGDRGVIAPGYRADLVLLAADPVADIRATRQIERVWAAGVPAATVQS